MSNKDIAHAYAQQMALRTNKCWISDNLPTLSRRERRDILDIYKKYFKVVEYDSTTGICKCWVSAPEPLTGTFGHFKSLNIDPDTAVAHRGDAIKQSTLASVGATNVVDAGTIVSGI